MSCIKDDMIQKYIDGETTPFETALVENHIVTCNECSKKIDIQNKLATSIKKAINLLEKDSTEIPHFSIHPKTINKGSLTNKRFIYIIAAASILLFLFIITPKKKIQKQNENIIELGFTMDVDANQPISKLPMVINIIDSKGNVTEYFSK